RRDADARGRHDLAARQVRGDPVIRWPGRNLLVAAIGGSAVGGTGPVELHPRLTIHVPPNPFDPATAVRGTMKFTGLPSGATVHLYTPTGAELWSGVERGFRVEWDGRNKSAMPVAR